MTRVKVAVIGGGITGQLVQLQIPEAELYDWKPAPRDIQPMTRNFGGNYLWEPIPGVPCRSFPVITHIDGMPATFDAILRYKAKIGKGYERNTVNNWPAQFQPTMLGYDFLSLPEPRVQYDHRIVQMEPSNHVIAFANGTQIQYEYLASTIPLYSLLAMVGMRSEANDLAYRPIYVRVMKNPPDLRYGASVYYVNYLSDPMMPAYRFTDRNGERHYEALTQLSDQTTRRIMPGKIYDNPFVSDYLHSMEAFDIYTFGRFGSWASDELVHETWNRIGEWKDAIVDRQEMTHVPPADLGRPSEIQSATEGAPDDVRGPDGSD